MFNMLIIDDDDKSRNELYRQISEFSDIDVLKTATDSFSALEVLEDFIPDVILLDVVMAKMDGLEMLKRIRFEKRFDNTVVIMMSSIMLDHIVNQAMAYKASYCLWKPVNMLSLHESICKMLAERKCQQENLQEIDDKIIIDQVIRMRLDDVGIDSKSKAYEYLVEGIKIICNEKSVYNVKIIEDVYKVVGAKFGVADSSVEHNVRLAIKKAWEKNADKMSGILSVNKRPKTGDFVAKIAHMIINWI